MTVMTAPSGAALVVGVVAGKDRQTDHVVEQAASFAHKLDAQLVIATVDAMHYEVRRRADGSVVAADIDPDLALEELTEKFDPQLADHLAAVAETSEVSCSFRALAGEPARELARLADELDAVAIVVGTRKQGLRASAHDFFNGSVAVHLAYRQRRPVIVVPIDPAVHGEPLPWEES
jgi:nucleotide-binding universal stress UspA family protein